MYAVSGLLVLVAGLCVLLYFLLHDSSAKAPVVARGSVAVVDGSVFVNGTAFIAETDSSFICATLDYGPSDHCDHGLCWGKAAILDLVSRLSSDIDFATMNVFHSCVYGFPDAHFVN